jgi:signal transduction histidine kinase
VDHLLRPQLEAAGIQWKIEAPPEVRVRADLQQIEQVLINLIQNAAESTERGGSVTLRAATRQERWPTGMAAATVLDVVDTGKGIAPEVARRLFDPFYSTKENGAGLGLSIAARIVEQHGGLLRYQTKPGFGTTFSVILPINEESKHGS